MAENPHYKRFLAAFGFLLDHEWKRRQKVLAIDAGISPGFISDIKNGKNIAGDEMQAVFAEKMGYPNFDDFIALGRSLIETGQPPLKMQESNQPPQPLPEQFLIVQVKSQTDKDILNGAADNYQGIPLYESGKLAAGVSGVEFDPYESPASIVVVYKPELKGCSKHNLAALKVGGDSMEPTITKGSIVVVDLSDKEQVEGKVFVVNTPESGIDMASVKRIQKWEKGFVMLSDNTKYPPVLSPLDWNRLCVGRVVWMWRNVKDV